MAKNSMRDMDIKNIKKPSMEKKVEFSMRPEIKPFYTPPVETLKKTPENIPAQSYQQVKYKSSCHHYTVSQGKKFNFK